MGQYTKYSPFPKHAASKHEDTHVKESYSAITVFGAGLQRSITGSRIHKWGLVLSSPTVKRLPKIGNGRLVHVSPMRVDLKKRLYSQLDTESTPMRTSSLSHLQFGDIPIFDLRVWWVVGPRDVHPFNFSTTTDVIHQKMPSSGNKCTDKHSPWWNKTRGSLHLYGRNCHTWPVVRTHTTRSHASVPNLFRASTESTT